MDAEDVLSWFNRTRERFRRPSDDERVEGRMSFFCFEAGRISSRSTGTPSETRKSRRMRERTQLGGCRGGGATSCDQRDELRSVRKIECCAETGGMEEAEGEDWVWGKISSR